MSDQPAPARQPGRRAEQDQVIANAISQAQQLLAAARDDPEAAPLLAGRGYDAAKLQEGLALQEAAQTAFNARQSARAAQQAATAALAEAEAAARAAHADFRATARAVFTASADRTALGLAGAVPRDAQKFLTAARASYTAGQGAAHAATLETYGFGASQMAAALAALEAFSAADQAQNAAIGAAVKATTDRDAAVRAINDWLKQFRRIAKLALRARPDLATRLGL